MKTWLQFVPLVGLGVILVACGDSSTEAQNGVENQVQSEVEAAQEDARSTDDPLAGAPKVSERYQSSINRGWEKAVAGENPAYACAGLKGRVMGTEETADPEALEALFACNVLLPVRYFETYLEQVEAGEKTCSDFRSDMMIKLPAMTLSVDSIQGMADAMEDGETPEDAASETLANAVDQSTLEKGLEDPERSIKDRLEEPVRSVCPDEADSILR